MPRETSIPLSLSLSKRTLRSARGRPKQCNDSAKIHHLLWFPCVRLPWRTRERNYGVFKKMDDKRTPSSQPLLCRRTLPECVTGVGGGGGVLMITHATVVGRGWGANMPVAREEGGRAIIATRTFENSVRFRLSEAGPALRLQQIPCDFHFLRQINSVSFVFPSYVMAKSRVDYLLLRLLLAAA